MPGIGTAIVQALGTWAPSRHTARMNGPPLGRRSRLGLLVAALCLLAGMTLLAGCDTLSIKTPSARKADQAGIELQRLQTRNMRFADDYVGRLMEAQGLARPSLTDADQRMLVSGWLLGEANAAYIRASGENPVIGTLDLLTLAVLSRMVVESLGPGGDALKESFLPAHRQLEKQAWELASTVLDATQLETVRNLFTEWRKRNPGFRNVMFVHFQDFVNIIGGEGASAGPTRDGGLFAVIGLDPLRGLDPAVQEVQLSRLLAARATYYAQRLPTLMDLQLERSITRIAAAPGAKNLQEQTASLAESAVRFAGVAEALPDVVAREREAAIRQVSDALTAQDATLRPMLLELRRALEAGSVTATSVDQAVRAIDALVARFSKEPGSASAQAGKPFDIDDYTRAAAEIARAASELQRLFGSIDAQTSQLDTALDESMAKGRSLIDYFFVRLVWLVVVLCAGVLATLLLYRWLAPRIRK